MIRVDNNKPNELIMENIRRHCKRKLKGTVHTIKQLGERQYLSTANGQSDKVFGDVFANANNARFVCQGLYNSSRLLQWANVGWRAHCVPHSSLQALYLCCYLFIYLFFLFFLFYPFFSGVVLLTFFHNFSTFSLSIICF